LTWESAMWDNISSKGRSSSNGEVPSIALLCWTTASAICPHIGDGRSVSSDSPVPMLWFVGDRAAPSRPAHEGCSSLSLFRAAVGVEAVSWGGSLLNGATTWVPRYLAISPLCLFLFMLSESAGY
jgi:hypothetical protein